MTRVKYILKNKCAKKKHDEQPNEDTNAKSDVQPNEDTNGKSDVHPKKHKSARKHEEQPKDVKSDNEEAINAKTTRVLYSLKNLNLHRSVMYSLKKKHLIQMTIKVKMTGVMSVKKVL